MVIKKELDPCRSNMLNAADVINSRQVQIATFHGEKIFSLRVKVFCSMTKKKYNLNENKPLIENKLATEFLLLIQVFAKRNS